MKIKHYQGYGSVNAKKISRTVENSIVSLHIKVTGNHEWGIHRDDTYDVANWLIKRFDKQFDDYRSIISLRLEDGYDTDKHEDTCDYFIKYRAA